VDEGMKDTPTMAECVRSDAKLCKVV